MYTHANEPAQECSTATTALVEEEVNVPTINFIKLTNVPNAPMYEPVIGVASCSFNPIKTISKVLGLASCGRRIKLFVTVAVFTDRFFQSI